MQNTKKSYSVAVTKEGDFLLVGGPAQPVLLFPKAQFDRVLKDPANTSPTKVTSILGIALIQIAHRAGAAFSTKGRGRPPNCPANAFILWMSFSNGLNVVYVDPDDLLAETHWFSRYNVSIVAGSQDFEVIGAPPQVLTRFIDRTHKVAQARRLAVGSIFEISANTPAAALDAARAALNAGLPDKPLRPTSQNT